MRDVKNKVKKFAKAAWSDLKSDHDTMQYDYAIEAYELLHMVETPEDADELHAELHKEYLNGTKDVHGIPECDVLFHFVQAERLHRIKHPTCGFDTANYLFNDARIKHALRQVDVSERAALEALVHLLPNNAAQSRFWGACYTVTLDGDTFVPHAGQNRRAFDPMNPSAKVMFNAAASVYVEYRENPDSTTPTVVFKCSRFLPEFFQHNATAVA
jgi:hypothetical protein